MQTNLELFSTSVAGNVLGVNIDGLKADEQNTEDNGIDINTILKYVEMIGQIVNEIVNICPANSKGVREAVKHPNWLQRVRFRAAVKQTCDCCAFLQFRPTSGKLADTLISESAKLTDDQIDKIISEVRDLDNWII
jgi:hypothetical protein